MLPIPHSVAAFETSPEQISFRQIKVFLVVAELRNLTLAAKQLNATQSVLSRTIQNLEAVAGESLFVRSPKGYVLTSFGLDFLPHARRLHFCYIATLTGTGGSSEKRFVLAGCGVVLPAVVPALFSDKSLNSDDCTLTVHELASHQVLNEVASGRADLGLCLYGGGREDLEIIPVLNAPLGLLADASLVERSFNTLEDLARVPMVRLADDMVLPQLLRARGVRLDAYFRSRVVSNTMSTLFTAVGKGQVATIVSAVAASSPPAHGLRFLPLPHLLPSLQLCVVTQPGWPAGPEGAKWVRAVCESVRRLPWLPAVRSVE